MSKSRDKVWPGMEDDESFVVFNIIFDAWNFGVEVNHEMRASAIKGVYKNKGKEKDED